MNNMMKVSVGHELLIIMIIGLLANMNFACDVRVMASADLESYAYPDYTTPSLFQFPNAYSKNDILFIKELNVTTSTDCNNLSYQPRLYVIKPDGNKEYLSLEETRNLINETIYFNGLKNRSKLGMISTGIYLKTTGDYELYLEPNVFDSNGNQIPSSYTLILKRMGGVVYPYIFTVKELSNITKITKNNLRIKKRQRTNF